MSIKRKYPRQVDALLDLKRNSRTNLSKHQKTIVLQLSEEDYIEWINLINHVRKLYTKYGVIIYEFIYNNISGITSRNCCHDWGITKTLNEKFEAILYALTLQELRWINLERETSWQDRKETREAAKRIETKFPNGFVRYKKEKYNNDKINISYSDVLRESGRIKEYQRMYDVAKSFEKWEISQNEFSKEIYKFLGETIPENGKYNYQVSYKKPKETGKIEDSKFKIWQSFPNGVSPYYLEYQPDYYKNLFSQLPELKSCSRYFLDSVYEKIFSLIKSFETKFHSFPIIVFVDNGNDGWVDDVYNYHFSMLKDLLDEEEIPFYFLSELNEIDDSMSKYILLIDFFTTNDMLKFNACRIIEHFEKDIPTIVYYSIIKQYDKDEIYELFKDEINWETKVIPFVKKQFERQNKHSFFSYYAITNTLIGQAADAWKVKPIWLENSNNYDLKSPETHKPNVISCDYTTDGWLTSNTFEYSGDMQNIDDVVGFTVELFKKMGVLKMFYDRGEKAISYMNEKGILAHH